MSVTRNVASFATPTPLSSTSVFALLMLHDGRSTPPHRQVVKTPLIAV